MNIKKEPVKAPNKLKFKITLESLNEGRRGIR